MKAYSQYEMQREREQGFRLGDQVKKGESEISRLRNLLEEVVRLTNTKADKHTIRCLILNNMDGNFRKRKGVSG